MPISAVARRAGVSWHLVNDLVRAWAALVGDHPRRKTTRVLLVVNTLLAAMPRILAWHTAARPSNGRIEGTINLLQVLRRSAHGFTNPHNFAARALLVT